ncbi:TOBE domain-containing protein [Rhodovulum sulfidophilum]|uniref:TOBE domain-containing protein n=1 Tax=Rhodovulum sulfidophilum TaxID=35806 RepID=UPI000951203E|nr:TOBE domain-containing protein [Rhodovulum sulfidophilum]MBL3551225.1 TOBE domain-containing protein [Rhodovulum sulfidophilum]OLS47865.1 transporter [Rhodovulum sulfidophilum]
MKLSARNILAGTVSAVETGTVTTHVKIDIGGATVTAAITNEAATDLDLKVGDKASAIIKSSDVLVGKD